MKTSLRLTLSVLAVYALTGSLSAQTADTELEKQQSAELLELYQNMDVNVSVQIENAKSEAASLRDEAKLKREAANIRRAQASRLREDAERMNKEADSMDKLASQMDADAEFMEQNATQMDDTSALNEYHERIRKRIKELGGE